MREEPMVKDECPKCGIEHYDRYKYYKNEWREQGYCFTCSFWAEIKAKYVDGRDSGHIPLTLKDGESIRINGIHYTAKDGDVGRGCGGRRFLIEFFDGRVIDTRNLWHQGHISDAWRDELPDNARFISGK